MFYDHNKIKLVVNNRKIIGKCPNIWKPINTLLNNSWVKEDIREELSHVAFNLHFILMK